MEVSQLVHCMLGKYTGICNTPDLLSITDPVVGSQDWKQQDRFVGCRV